MKITRLLPALMIATTLVGGFSTAAHARTSATTASPARVLFTEELPYWNGWAKDSMVTRKTFTGTTRVCVSLRASKYTSPEPDLRLSVDKKRYGFVWSKQPASKPMYFIADGRVAPECITGLDPKAQYRVRLTMSNGRSVKINKVTARNYASE